jgi:hypothetical protein
MNPVQRSDPAAIVAAVIEKSRAGKLPWQPTDEDETFVVGVPNVCTLRVFLQRGQARNQLGEVETVSVPTLQILNDRGRVIWMVDSRQVADLRELHRLAQNRANRVDEKIAQLMETLKKL